LRFAVTVAIRFELRDPLGGVHFVEPRDGYFNDRPRHCFTTAAICESRLFMPCVDTFAELEDGGAESGRLTPQYPTWELAFTVAPGLTAVSVGTLDRQLVLPDGRTIFHYRLNNPTGAHGIGFAVGPFELYPDPKVSVWPKKCCVLGARAHVCVCKLFVNSKRRFMSWWYLSAPATGSWHVTFLPSGIGEQSEAHRGCVPGGCSVL
jgi:hypothetical protein